MLYSQSMQATHPESETGVWRVVVADDEPEFRSWIRSLLEAARDFLVVGEAGTGTEALAVIPRLRPDLVIADLYMPGPDGLEVVKYVQDTLPHTKAILVSAHTERVFERLAKDAGALTFIPKAAFSVEAVRRALKGEV